jgi:adenine-specific DNA-methyltransferase
MARSSTKAALAAQSAAEASHQHSFLFVSPSDLVSELVPESGCDLEAARCFTYHLAQAYWGTVARDAGVPHAVEAFGLRFGSIGKTARSAISAYGSSLAGMDISAASFEIGRFYMALLPAEFRAAQGIYYTPPTLVSRLLAMVEAEGIRWDTARAIDPACGGGAFVAPIVAKKIAALRRCSPQEVLQQINSTVRGLEIDPFAAWLSQFFAEIVALPLRQATGKSLARLVEVTDSLQPRPADEGAFDVIIGNPPYSRVTLAPEMRRRYARSLYGHANLYGMFTDQALRFARTSGLVAYVTPTSFLGGQYFQNLRHTLRAEAGPARLEFVSERSGVFEDVLQETLLAVYRKGAASPAVSVSLLESQKEGAAPRALGDFPLPVDLRKPWLLPRTAAQRDIIVASRHLTHTLADYGYSVNTGPLVWNRHKAQMAATPGANRYPIVWAESVSADGVFAYRAEKKNHAPFLRWEGPQDDWLLTDRPCVLVQRTTSKEQSRRLICAVMPPSFLKRHRAVAVENHLNMVRASARKPRVSIEAIAAVLRSRIADELFRCINGSVAVSAYELESLPLPGPTGFAAIEGAIKAGESEDEIDALVGRLYMSAHDAASA